MALARHYRAATWDDMKQRHIVGPKSRPGTTEQAAAGPAGQLQLTDSSLPRLSTMKVSRSWMNSIVIG